jgi:hypothetical protein
LIADLLESGAMVYLELLQAEAIRRGLLEPKAILDPALVFSLVRDMPYRRASDRRPETIIAEWRGTCSGKHYLLQALFAELGLRSKVMACTSVTSIDPADVSGSLQDLYESAKRCFVDVHNFLQVSLPHGGYMVVDATWPLSARGKGLVVNETFVLGKDHRLAAEPQEIWVVPEGRDPQEFKEELLKKNFTLAELEFREEVICALGERSSS